MHADLLQRLVDALPRCCACQQAVAEIVNHDRWWICESCWLKVPGSAQEPLLDLRQVIRESLKELYKKEANK